MISGSKACLHDKLTCQWGRTLRIANNGHQVMGRPTEDNRPDIPVLDKALEGVPAGFKGRPDRALWQGGLYRMVVSKLQQ